MGGFCSANVSSLSECVCVCVGGDYCSVNAVSLLLVLIVSREFPRGDEWVHQADAGLSSDPVKIRAAARRQHKQQVENGAFNMNFW